MSYYNPHVAKMETGDYIDFIMIGAVSMICMFVSFGWIFFL